MPGWFLTVLQQNLFLLITRLKRERLPNNTFIGEKNYNSWHLYPYFLLFPQEEESLFPKATDQSFAAKLHENLLGKCENFQKANPKPDPNAHFAVIHYAATVSYNLTSWLEKNKDPLNDNVVELMKNGSNALLVKCFEDHPGQPIEAKKDSGGGRKKGGGKTVSSFYKGQVWINWIKKYNNYFEVCQDL